MENSNNNDNENPVVLTNTTNFDSQEEIKHTASVGEMRIGWDEFKIILIYHLNNTFQQYKSKSTQEELSLGTTEPEETYLINQLSKFSNPPFTLQRICELVIDPTRYYKSINKFLFAFTKVYFF